MNHEGEGIVLAHIHNPKYKKDKLVYLADDSNKARIKDEFSKLVLDDPDSKFELGINKDTERNIYYIAGASGSGKSYFAKQLISKYKKAHPKNEVYVFSSVDTDPAIDALKVNRIKLNELLQEDVPIEEFANSLLLFDDTDCISNKKIKERVHNISNEALQKGRHSKVSCIFTSHIVTDGRNTRHILNECHYITIFPKNANARNLEYLLGSYMGMSKEQIQYIKNMKTRPLTIAKCCYPQVIITDHEICFSKDLLAQPSI